MTDEERRKLIADVATFSNGTDVPFGLAKKLAEELDDAMLERDYEARRVHELWTASKKVPPGGMSIAATQPFLKALEDLARLQERVIQGPPCEKQLAQLAQQIAVTSPIRW